MTKILPPIPEPYIDTWPLTPEKLRARDQEIVAAVLEAAAQASELWHANGIETEIAREIRALEFKHHE